MFDDEIATKSKIRTVQDYLNDAIQNEKEKNPTMFENTQLKIGFKMNSIEKFYRQQKAHGVVLPVRYRCDAIFAILFNAAIDRLWKTIRPIIKRMRIR